MLNQEVNASPLAKVWSLWRDEILFITNRTNQSNLSTITILRKPEHIWHGWEFSLIIFPANVPLLRSKFKESEKQICNLNSPKEKLPKSGATQKPTNTELQNNMSIKGAVQLHQPIKITSGAQRMPSASLHGFHEPSTTAATREARNKSNLSSSVVRPVVWQKNWYRRELLHCIKRSPAQWKQQANSTQPAELLTRLWGHEHFSKQETLIFKQMKNTSQNYDT